MKKTFAQQALLAVALTTAAGACGPQADRVTPDTPAATGVVDSILPMDEYLRRFRAGVDSVATFTGGANSADSLVRAFVAALATRDTTAVRALAITRAEYAWLYFPNHELSRPPYEISPAFLWSQMLESSTKGITRAFNRYGGQPLRLRAYSCDDSRRVMHGPITERPGCVLTLQGSGPNDVEILLFSALVEMRGHHKILSYANDL